MTIDVHSDHAHALRQLFRRARFEDWQAERFEHEALRILRGEVDEQPAPTPDQPAGPPSA